MTKKKTLYIFFLLLFTFEGFCQDDADFQYRLIPSVNYRFNKHWKISGEYRYSLHKDLQEFRSSAGQFDVEYNFNKNISFQTGYRFTTSFEKDNHRLFCALKFDKKLDAFKLFSSFKYQFDTGSFDNSYMNYYKEPRQMVREKIGLDYNIPKSKASVYIAAEIFLKIADTDPIKFNRMRYEAGSAYKFKHGSTLVVSIFYDDKINTQKTDRLVLETKYTLSVDNLLKKSNKSKKSKKISQE
jgi:hypothetical protein